MNIWSDHPEELEELSAEHLPEPWRTWVKDGHVLFCNVPENLRFPAMDRGMEDYMSRKIDEAEMCMEDR